MLFVAVNIAFARVGWMMTEPEKQSSMQRLWTKTRGSGCNHLLSWMTSFLYPIDNKNDLTAQ